MDHRAQRTTRASNAASRRIWARLWNAGIGRIDGWPEIRLIEPPVKAAEGPAWDDFPTRFRTGIEGYLTGLERIRPEQGRTSQPAIWVIAGLITSKRRNESKKLLQLDCRCILVVKI
jgi:hypothetical protein